MAVGFEVDHQRSSEYRILPQYIDVRPELNGRHNTPDIEWLIQDILKQGQIVPIAVWNDGGKPVLAAGFSRWRAISEINKRKLAPKPMELRCTYVRCNERSAFLMNISENRFRNETTAIDDAHNIQRLTNVFLMKDEEVAQLYFPVAKTAEEVKQAVKWVKDRVALISLTPEAEEAVKSGRLKGTAAVAISKLKAAQQREVIKKAGDGKISGKDVAAAKPAKAPKKPKVIGDPELKRRATAVVKDIDWKEEIGAFIAVDAVSLRALNAYLEEK